MAYGKERRFFSGAGAAAVALTLSIAGCSTSTVEDVAEAPGRSGQPTDTGTFPNLNLPRQAATTQLSNEETQAKLAYLNSLQRSQSPGATSSAESAEAARRRMQLAVDEQEETLRLIEGQ